jgi:imidazolonepropionase-like amidohydrolase
MKDRIIAIVDAKIFDGERIIEGHNVIIKGEKILNVGGPVPEGAEIVDAKGCTLLPGLIDAHSHPKMETLKFSLTFGVTTTFQMQGFRPKEIKERRDLTDCLTSFGAIGAPGGHPSELLTQEDIAQLKIMVGKIGEKAAPKKSAATPEEAASIVAERVEQGADYVKIMIEDGIVFGHPGTPDVTNEVIKTACTESHRFGKMAVAHTMSIKATERAINAGIDGLMHIFIDKPYTKQIIGAIVNSGVFVCPTIAAGASVIGDSDAPEFAKDERVSSKLSEEWLNALYTHIGSYPQGKMEYLLKTVKTLHDAGVDILAGSDASIPSIGGMVHGASLHHELQLLVRAGLAPIEALRAATSVPARRFGMNDRGRIVNGARADLLLVKGDPTVNISDTLSTVAVWRQGVRTNMTKLTERDLLLFEAIKNGNIEKIETSLNNGANINIFCVQYEVYRRISPLEYAIYCNASADIITCLIDHGAKIDEVNEDRKRSILEIVICFYKENTIVDYLLRKGAQFATEQHRYAFEGNIKALQEIHQDIRENINKVKTASGCTLLHYAVASGKLNVVQWLLKEGGAQINEKDDFGLTALSCAASKGHLEVVKWLLKEGGAQIDERTRRGLTILLCAASKGQLEVVEWLLEEGGAKIGEKDNEGNTALLFAAMNGELETVQWLLEHGASLQERNEQGRTAVELIPGEENKEYLLQFNLKPKN